MRKHPELRVHRHVDRFERDPATCRFAQNGDPRFSADVDEEYRQLFASILNHAPEEMVGGAARA